MPVTPSTSVTPLPALDRTSPTFKTSVDTFFSTQLPTFTTEINTLATGVEDNATYAESQASASAISASAAQGFRNAAEGFAQDAEVAVSAAASAGGAAEWNPLTNYTEGQCVRSPVDYQTYRRVVSGVSTTDPSSDAVNWAVVGGSGVTVTGNLTIYATQSTVLTITNYDSIIVYNISATGGTVARTGDQITYTAGSVAGGYFVTINGRNIPITVNAASVFTPTITSPTNGATGIGQSPTFTTSAFATIGVSDTFLNADHEVRTGANGTGTLIASSYANTTSETSWTMPGGLLNTATGYHYRVRHRGTMLGASGWSEISFTTAAQFGGLIGTQGGQGFGVGVYPDTLPAGFSNMVSNTDPAHANYGNYTTNNGSIMVFVPKFYYRIGNAASPRFTTYGANAVDVV